MSKVLLAERKEAEQFNNDEAVRTEDMYCPFASALKCSEATMIRHTKVCSVFPIWPSLPFSA